MTQILRAATAGRGLLHMDTVGNLHRAGKPCGSSTGGAAAAIMASGGNGPISTTFERISPTIAEEP